MRSRTLSVVAVALLVSAGSTLAAVVDITINKVSQKMTVRIDGSVKYVWPVSTGAPGYDTPSGKFRPFRLEEEHYSTEWDDAPMPHSIFFTGEGHAIHGTEYTKSLGRRASHGCIRLSQKNAETLFGVVSKNGLKNTSVAIKGGFFDFSFEDGPVLPKGFRLGSKSANTEKATVKRKKKRISIFGNIDG